MMKKAVSVFAAFLLVFGLSGFAFAEEASTAAYSKELVFDRADLLDKSQEKELTEKAQSLSVQYQADFVLVTTDDAKGKTAQAYADDFYDEHKFGYDEEYGRGLLLLIDMDNREVWLSIDGDRDAAVHRLFPESVCQSLIGQAAEYLPDDAYGAFTVLLDGAQTVFSGGTKDEVFGGYEDEFFDNGYDGIESLPPGTTQQPVKRWYQRLSIVPVVIGIAAGAVAVLIMRKNTGGTMTVGNSTYEVRSAKRIVAQNDQLVNVRHTTRHLDPPPSASTHTSSGGHTHGGGGSHF